MKDDLIGRQAAISLPVKPREDRYFQTQSLDDAYDYGWRSLQRCIENLPSAQTERKRGKWIEVNDAYNRISGRCSVCGWEAHMYEDDVVGMPFCPSCGADMRQREEQ